MDEYESKPDCPKCQSSDVKFVGKRDPQPPHDRLEMIIYQCLKCGEMFAEPVE
jgi:ribosomal protein L37AE/L43A